jgi:protein TonB
MLHFVLDRSGRVISYRIIRSSGHEILDKAVETLIQRASPMPPLPDSLSGDTLEIDVPVDFFIR